MSWVRLHLRKIRIDRRVEGQVLRGVPLEESEPRPKA